MTRRSPNQLSLLAATATATTLVFLSALPHVPLLVWNDSASAPIGLYLTLAVPRLSHGDLVLADLPPDAAALAVARRYLGPHTPVIKPVAALSGDVVCAGQGRISINGKSVALRLARDSNNRPLKGWTGCRRLGADDVFLLNPAVSHSFDGRYFGPVSKAAIIAGLMPLWTR